MKQNLENLIRRDVQWKIIAFTTTILHYQFKDNVRLHSISMSLFGKNCFGMVKICFLGLVIFFSHALFMINEIDAIRGIFVKQMPKI